MSVEWLAELGWKSLLISALAVALLALARRRSAAEKSLVGDAALLSLLVLPLAMQWLPRIELASPTAVGTAFQALVTEPAIGTSSAAASGAPVIEQSFDWNAAFLAIYFVGVAALLGVLGYSLLRLQQLHSRARLLEDARWLTALAAAQNRLGLKHGTALLISEEINSPISWGVIRPVIMIDPAARSATDEAEAIIAHELAHVHRLDWLKLVGARLVTAIFWFNPLVWVLARRCHQLREEAADDAVLRTRVPTADYAKLLVTAVRHANGRPLLAANGVAPSKSSIALRVDHVLDSSRPRQPARLRWAAACIAIALTANGALAATEPVVTRGWATDETAGERAAAELAAVPSVHAKTLARAMQARDWRLRRVRGDTNFSDTRAVRPLILALRDDDPIVRRIAVWGLSEMRPTPASLATPPVSRLLNDPAAEVRAEAAGAIGDFKSVKNSRSIEKLVLRDPSPLVRIRAAHALGDIQDPNSRSTLQLALEDPDPGVRSKARWALGQVIEAEELINR